ncbi:MAG: dienelactone hydrolase family protein [Candidatus Kapabacteria bacterium]|nr:dienelactone hydrolase family protein [Candidatus Kapabacteria bacterium]MBX7154310.1 dienelactone hydrolase family protein [Bacteroidota bacterium]
MKVILFISLIVCVARTYSVAQQCCSGKSSSTAQFAMLTKSTAFKKAHAEPLPFTLSEQHGAMITIPCDDGKKANVYEVRAEQPTKNVVVMVHEWWGLNDYIKREADRLHHELGNVTIIAIDLYDGNVATKREEAAAYMSAAKEERIRTILKAVQTYMGNDAHVCTIGWCFGGGWSLQASLQFGNNAVGCVMYYGMPESDTKKLQQLHAPVLGIFANKDKWITPAVVKTFADAMKQLGKQCTIAQYDADHAFANPSNPGYAKEFAEEAHTKVVEFMKKCFAQ